jgi:hypothetical protein
MERAPKKYLKKGAFPIFFGNLEKSKIADNF